MRFLADMGVARDVVRWLREQGHDAVHLLDLGLERLPDREIFAKAAAERRILLTFDLDFGEIAAMTRDGQAIVLLFRLSSARYEHVRARLARCLAQIESRLAPGIVVIVEETRFRVRHMRAET